jgi:hypothetical protein
MPMHFMVVLRAVLADAQCSSVGGRMQIIS